MNLLKNPIYHFHCDFFFPSHSPDRLFLGICSIILFKLNDLLSLNTYLFSDKMFNSALKTLSQSQERKSESEIFLSNGCTFTVLCIHDEAFSELGTKLPTVSSSSRPPHHPAFFVALSPVISCLLLLLYTSLSTLC